MARLSKAEQKKKDAARRQRESRARKEEAGLERLSLVPEVLTVRLIEAIARAEGKSVSEVVIDLSGAMGSLGSVPEWLTQDCPPHDFEVQVPESVKEALSSHPRMSASGALEWLVLLRCRLAGVDDFSLIYDHNGTVLETGMAHHVGGIRTASGTVYDKYETRLDTVARHGTRSTVPDLGAIMANDPINRINNMVERNAHRDGCAVELHAGWHGEPAAVARSLARRGAPDLRAGPARGEVALRPGGGPAA